MTNASARDLEDVTRLLGRKPLGGFVVVVRDENLQPVVIRNAPFMYDRTPMPTRYWLTSPELIKNIGHLESTGGVKLAESEVDPAALQAAHLAYAQERDAQIASEIHPKPSGGVGGTRRGVKCLHAHYAYFLAGGNDPVGEWVHARLQPS